MKRAAITMLLLVACGSDPDPHELGPCQGWVDNQGNPFTGMCEAACRTPPASTGMTCDTVALLNCNAFMVGDARGCCVPEPAGPVRFVECAN